MKPILYNETGTTQLGVLTECIECYTTEERNGTFSLTLSYPITDSLHHQLVHGKIIKCKPNDEQDEQLFRICNTERIISGLIHVVALHISFDLSYDYIGNVNIQNQSCEYALNTLFRGSQFSSHYRGYSDIVNAQNYKISNVNITEAIAGSRGSIIDTFGTGAEIKRDNTDIYVYNKRGVNKGVTIEYGVNLLDESLKVDIEDLATSIIGTATQTNEDGTQQIITTSRIDSPNINNYVHPYILYKDYTDRFSPEETITEEKIINLINQDYQQLKLDQPKCSYTIDFVPLSKCSGYEDIEDKIHLCDTVRIIDSRYNIDTEAKVIKYTYDVLTERYETMELGDPRNTLADLMSNATKGEKGEKGDKGDKGDKGEDGNIGDFPDTLPSTPVIQGQCIGFGSIQLEWTFENLVYYTYEVYGSLTQGFTPNEFDLIHKGNTSSFLFQAEPGTTWYFRVCCVNSYGRRTAFSSELKIQTSKADDFEDYFTNVAIGNAVVNSLSADYMRVGVIKGEWVDAKNLSVTDGNGKRTLDIDSFGNVNIDATTINATAGNLVNGISRVEQTADKINWVVSSGTSSSNMTLTSDMLKVMSENIDLTGKVTFKSFNAEVNSFIEESQDTSDKVETWSGGTTTINGDYITTGVISDANENVKIDLNNGKIEIKSMDGLTIASQGVVTEEQYNETTGEIEQLEERLVKAELAVKPDAIISTVSSTFATKEELSDTEEDINLKMSQVEQTADKINWLVSSGTSSSNMEMTSDALSVISKNIDLTGKVTFNSLSQDLSDEINNTSDKVELWSGGTTTINGSHIKTGVISDDAQSFMIDLDNGTIRTNRDSFSIIVGDQSTVVGTLAEIEANRKQVEDLEDVVGGFDDRITDTETKVDGMEDTVDGLSNEVARVESRVSYAEQQITQDSIVNKVVSSEKWLHATGGVNTIPNPTAQLNLNGWTSSTGSYITRYQVLSTSATTPEASDLPSYVPAPPNSSYEKDESTEGNVYTDNSENIRHPELHLIDGTQIENYALAMLLIDCSGKVIFIDGGYSSNASHCVSYMQGRGVNKIDYYICTHCHTDHGEAIPQILDSIPCDNMIIKTLDKSKLTSQEIGWTTDIVYDRIIEKCNQLNIPILSPSTNSYIKLSNNSGLYIYNAHNSYFDNYNHQSLMTLYKYEDKKVFLAADGTNKADVSVLGLIGEVDFFQVGHHGDGTEFGSSEALINELKADYVYFACDAITGTKGTTKTRVQAHGAKCYYHGNNGDMLFYITTDGIKTNAKTF